MPNNTFSSFYIPMPPPPPPAQPPKPPAPPAAQQPPASPPPPPPPPPAKAEVPPPPPPPEPKPAPKSGILFRSGTTAATAATATAAPPAPAPTPAVIFEPLPMTAPPVEPAAPPPNLFLAVMKRWQWLAIGLVGGLVGGLLIYLQRPATYQSHAQLLVIKNRPESSSAGGDSRSAYVEDYVATQVTLLKSEKILRLAAARLDDQKPFTVPPPEKDWERIAYLGSRFSVARDREPGTNTPSNVLALSFRAAHPTDAPKYLQAIIEAYQGVLVTLYEDASAKRVTAITTEIETYQKELNTRSTALSLAQRELSQVSQENLSGIRIRIGTNRNSQGELALKKLGMERDIETITKTSPTNRQERLTVMEALGVKVERAGNGLDARTPEDILLALDLQKSEMAKKYGEEHPDMIAINDRIKLLQGMVAKQADGGAKKTDELDRYLARLKNELAAVEAQDRALKTVIDKDEKHAADMTTFQNKIDTEKAAADSLQRRIDEKRLEKDQVSNSMRTGGYSASAITPPGDGGLVAPIMREWLMLGGVLGLMLGGGLGLMAELSDRSFRSPAEIRRKLGVAVLGHVPRLRTEATPENPSRTGLDPSLVAFLRPSSAEAEAYRGVRVQLSFSAQGRGNALVQVTSPNPGDGKSTLAANLAITIAQTGKRVVLVDCDFRKPRVHKLFAIPGDKPGVAAVMDGDATLAEATQTCEVPGLSLLPCGPRPDRPGDLLTRPKFQELLAELRGMYDFVLVDTPPVLAVADPKEVARRVDGVLMVVRMTKDARPKAERAKEDLSAVGARILGVVVNASTAKSAGYGGYGYSYQYTEGYTNYGPDDGKPLPKKG
jgi:succinoglycan biosynthesis transport protein ExoP